MFFNKSLKLDHGFEPAKEVEKIIKKITTKIITFYF